MKLRGRILHLALDPDLPLLDVPAYVEQQPPRQERGNFDEFTLEWTSDATLTDGRPLQYRGVTVIVLDGDKITKLRTYYDSAQFAAMPAETA